ncbi:hypothetical protein GWD52_21100 [Enterobacteriaceae bacterium 4M9]|nr:hypothetical protein [Enterobacteriaceae bacterium 4M9]
MAGLWIPGAPVIGNVQSGGSGSDVDFSDIDFTAVKQDGRVLYSRPGNLSFIARSGLIEQAPDNVWPLEYKNGVAVGRHEPEPQRTNPILDSRVTGTGWRAYNADIKGTTIAPDGEQTKLIIKSVATADGGMYQTRVLLGLEFPITLSVYGKSKGVFQVYAENTGAANQITFRTAVEWQYAAKTIPAGAANANYNGTVVVYSNSETLLGDAFAGWSVQAETGTFATSPILTSTAGATRAEPIAQIQNPGGQATAIRVHYTDGTYTDVSSVNGADFDIPKSTRQWATRYITRVQYSRGF